MTLTPPEPSEEASGEAGNERNWDAEFDEIVHGLTLDTGEPALPASRYVAPDVLAQPAQTAPAEGRDSRDRSSDFGPSDEAEPELNSQQVDPKHTDWEQNAAVPGFRPEWRLGQHAATVPSTDVGLEPDADDFVPPEPAGLDMDDPHATIMIAALVLGPLWLMYLLLFDRYASLLWWALAIGVTVAGFGLAVARQPKSRDDEDPSDDGARV